jgi:hypothetical protein
MSRDQVACIEGDYLAPNHGVPNFIYQIVLTKPLNPFWRSILIIMHLHLHHRKIFYEVAKKYKNWPKIL